jgi:hypothetical protein
MQRVTVESACPYCGEALSLEIDESAGRRQSYVEDCAVCCHAIEVRVTLDGDDVDVRVSRQDD